MASNGVESHPPPRKSRRLASMSSRESIQTPLAGNVQNSVQSQFNELLTAAISTITQSVITALQQVESFQTQTNPSDPQCRAQSGDTVQSLTTTQNDTQAATLSIIAFVVPHEMLICRDISVCVYLFIHTFQLRICILFSAT